MRVSPEGATEITPPSDWPQKGKINFKNVKLRYRPDTELVLTDLSYTAEAGHKVGIVGRTGCGKSTMGLALSRIVEIEGGLVEIDGVEVSKVDLTLVRSKITVIPQDPVIFNGTLKFNLDPSGTIPDEEIETLMKEAGLGDLLKRKPDVKDEADDELDIELDDKKNPKNNGTGIYFKLNDSDSLSGGEKQLICICRAVLRKNKIVLMDEATANIDIVTEEKIQALMSKAFANATVFTIAHRINTIINSDRVMVLGEGKCLEYADPKISTKDPNSEFAKLISEKEEEEKKEKEKKKEE